MGYRIRNRFWGVVFDVTYWLYTKMPEGSAWEVYLLNKCREITIKGGLKNE